MIIYVWYYTIHTLYICTFTYHIIYSTIGICRAVFLESAIISIPGPNISLRVHTPTGIQLPVANQGPPRTVRWEAANFVFQNIRSVPSLKLTKPLKMMVSNRNLLIQGSILRGYVSFRDGNPSDPWAWKRRWFPPGRWFNLIEGSCTSWCEEAWEK